MSLLTITYIALAAILALGLAFFQYFYKSRKRGRNAFIFLFLRFAGIFIVLLLLINPKMVTRSYEVEKPDLVLAVDNSASIARLKQQGQVQRLINNLKENKFIQQNFDLSEFSFGKGIASGDSLEFDQSQTDINAALNDLKDLYKRRNAALILITDGNQTLGRDYSYFKTSGNIQLFPVVAGDTSTYADLQLSRLNVNRYAFLNNRFPVETILNYYGTDPVTTQFQIKSGDAVVFTQKISFDSEKTSVVVHAELPANRLGVLTYEAELIPSSAEKNILNNTEKFAVEVIDERS
ncbi:MAG: vWA domain-containing protein, partial [Salegentibacter sp.]